MGKRKHVSKEKLLKKIRKLERQIQETPESDSDSDNVARAPSHTEVQCETEVEETSQPNLLEKEGGATDIGQEDKERESEKVPGEKEEPLPESLINILGDDGLNTTETQNCLPQIAVRWENILKSGLKKETKESLDIKYKSFLSNCPSLTPPKLNIEIKAAVSESALKRDCRIVEEQKQLAAIITSLGLAMTELIQKDPLIEGLERLSDSARMLCNLHYETSKNRRNLLVSGLNKDVKDLTDNTPIETLLFGNDFTDKIKASQAAKKLSAQSLKPTVVNKVNKERPKQNLNYRGPLRQQAPYRQSGQRTFHKPGNKRNNNYQNSNYQSNNYQRPSYKKQPPNRKH